MFVVYAKIEPATGLSSMFARIADTSQRLEDGERWYQEGLAQPDHHDVLVVYFPDYQKQQSEDFSSWAILRPSLTDATTVLDKDGVSWKLWSTDKPEEKFGCDSQTLVLSEGDLKLLKSMRIKWDSK
jgi:hypothetical protein